MLSSLKNAAMASNSFIEVPHSNECEAILKVLEKDDFVFNVKTFKLKESKRKMIHVDLTKDGGDIKISQVKRLSKPGKRVYRKASQIKLVRQRCKKKETWWRINLQGILKCLE